MSFQIIYPDPAWKFKVYSQKGEGRSPKYPTMDLAALFELPVHRLAEKDSVMFMWVTSPFMQIGIDLMNTWGFTYKTMAFTWVKNTQVQHEPFLQHPKNWSIGTGYYTRANAEFCLLGTRGKGLKRMDKSVPQLIVAPRKRHSEKPDVAYYRIERLFGEVSRVELFARQTRAGWTSLGNEIDGRDLRETLLAY